MIPQIGHLPGDSLSDSVVRLDVLVPTHNRARLLERTIRSVLDAVPAPDLDVHITVICNHCTDDSIERVAALQADAPGRISVLEERRRGKSRALNLGIASTSGELVGMIDDDEEVDQNWLRVIARAFKDERLDFMGGPYVACWDTPPPEWVPKEYMAVLGSAYNGAVTLEYDREFQGMVKGGNAVMRRRTLERVGPYAEHLGPGGSARLFSCEDEEMYLRLLEHGARGRYEPTLIVYHHVSLARLTPEYYRRWCFWRGVSRGLMDLRHPLPVPYFIGVPRFLYGRAIGSLLRLGRGLAEPRPARERLRDELRVWDLAGYFFGRHVYPLARFWPGKSRRTGGTRRLLPPVRVSQGLPAPSSVNTRDDEAARTA
jgi:glycosyltransferase involved in cell wall biosynthesis